MASSNWWDNDNFTCAFNDHITCMELGICENCEHHPKNRNQSRRLDYKQITIDEVLNDKDKNK